MCRPIGETVARSATTASTAYFEFSEKKAQVSRAQFGGMTLPMSCSKEHSTYSLAQPLNDTQDIALVLDLTTVTAALHELIY